MLFSHVEGKLVVPINIIFFKARPINQMWAVMVYDSTEAKTIPPACGHVDNIDLWLIVGSDIFAPGLQGLSPVQRHAGGFLTSLPEQFSDHVYLQKLFLLVIHIFG